MTLDVAGQIIYSSHCVNAVLPLIASPTILGVLMHVFLVIKFYVAYPCMLPTSEVFPAPSGFLTLYIRTLLILYLGHINHAHNSKQVTICPIIPDTFVIDVHSEAYLMYHK